jgi:archaellum biogenesis ATPase FlaH
MTDFTSNGALVEIAGGKQSGKTLFLQIICSINSLENRKTCYIDNVGKFDPKFIFRYLEGTKTLKNKEIYAKMKYISIARAYEINDLIAIIKKLRIMDYSCVVFDDLLIFYSYRHDRNAKEEIRNIIRELALLALNKRTCIIFTNPIVWSLNNKFYLGSTYELRYNDIIRYIHFKAIINKGIQDVLDCKFIYPAKLENTRLSLVTQGSKKYRI